MSCRPGPGLAAGQLDALRDGRWEAFGGAPPTLPSAALRGLAPGPGWSPALAGRFLRELERTGQRLQKLDRRLRRDLAARALGRDPERLRQALFPLGRPQERVVPGLFWLRDEALLDRMRAALDDGATLALLEQP